LSRSTHAVALVAFPAAIIGGLDSTGGAIVGGAIVGLTEALSAQYLSYEFSKVAVYVGDVGRCWWPPRPGCSVLGAKSCLTTCPVRRSGRTAGDLHRSGAARFIDRIMVVRVLFLTAIAIAVITPPMYLGPGWMRVGQYVMIGAVGAIGLTLLTGQAGQLSLATPFFMFVGGTAYACWGQRTSRARSVWVCRRCSQCSARC